jgi:hypothetical protein
MSQVEETVEVKIQPTVYVEVMMPGGVLQVFERPIYAEVAAVGPQGAAGPPGINGLPGPPGQSAILGTWEGEWAAGGGPALGGEYPPLSLVQHQGSTYLNAGGFLTSAQPPAAPWELVAAKGDPGPQGTSGALFSYTHTQLTPAAVWTVVHGLGGFPNVTAIDSADSEIVGDLLYIDSNTVQITFSSGTAGKAYIS